MTANPARQRLDQLECFLLVDGANATLLAEAFDAAMQAGEPERARRHLSDGSTVDGDNPAWRLRRAQWLLASNRLEEARAELQCLAEQTTLPAAVRSVLSHDLAYVALRVGDSRGARAALAATVDVVPAQQPMADGLQVLWLRVLHRTGELQGAMAWAGARWNQRQLAAAAAGVASLIALDAHDFVHCDAWSAYAIDRFPQQPEALVGRASVALARRQPAQARVWLETALRSNRGDGRAWSTLGFAQLLEHDLAGARQSFDTALRFISSHIGTWHGAGWAALLEHDVAVAQRCFETALALDRSFAESHGGLAVVLAVQKQAEAARAAVARAMRLDRGNISARYAHALLQGEIGDLQALRRLAERLLGNVLAPLGGSVLDLLPSAGVEPLQ